MEPCDNYYLAGDTMAENICKLTRLRTSKMVKKIKALSQLPGVWGQHTGLNWSSLEYHVLSLLVVRYRGPCCGVDLQSTQATARLVTEPRSDWRC